LTSETAAGILRGDHDDYLILIETGRASVNYSACSPEVPGCVAVGDTIDRTAWEMRAALVGHLDVMWENGERMPRETGPGVLVEQ